MGQVRETRQARDWDDLAAVDPLWAVLAADGKRGGRWELDEFFATGEVEVEAMLATAAHLERPTGRARALDFGCGVGRLTRPLAARFDDVVGVDVSGRMIELARRLNPEATNVTFTTAGEPPAGPFNFVVANLMLQHLPNEALARDYIGRLIGALGTGGILVFQAPHRLHPLQRLQPRRRIYAGLRGLGLPPQRLFALGLHPVRMLAIPPQDVEEIVTSLGAEVALADPAGQAGLRYYVHHRSP